MALIHQLAAKLADIYIRPLEISLERMLQIAAIYDYHYPV
jgi:hypothetical protein